MDGPVIIRSKECSIKHGIVELRMGNTYKRFKRTRYRGTDCYFWRHYLRESQQPVDPKRSTVYCRYPSVDEVLCYLERYAA